MCEFLPIKEEEAAEYFMEGTAERGSEITEAEGERGGVCIQMCEIGLGEECEVRTEVAVTWLLNGGSEGV